MSASVDERPSEIRSDDDARSGPRPMAWKVGEGALDRSWHAGPVAIVTPSRRAASSEPETPRNERLSVFGRRDLRRRLDRIRVEHDALPADDGGDLVEAVDRADLVVRVDDRHELRVLAEHGRDGLCRDLARRARGGDRDLEAKRLEELRRE